MSNNSYILFFTTVTSTSESQANAFVNRSADKVKLKEFNQKPIICLLSGSWLFCSLFTEKAANIRL